jgi:hypothetical protein
MYWISSRDSVPVGAKYADMVDVDGSVECCLSGNDDALLERMNASKVAREQGREHGSTISMKDAELGCPLLSSLLTATREARSFFSDLEGAPYGNMALSFSVLDHLALLAWPW